MVGAREHAVDERSRGGEVGEDPRLDGDESVPTEQPVADTGLVGDHHHRDASPIGGGDHLGRAVDQPDFLGPVQMIDFLDDYAVTIEEQRGTQGRAFGPAQHLDP